MMYVWSLNEDLHKLFEKRSKKKKIYTVVRQAMYLLLKCFKFAFICCSDTIALITVVVVSSLELILHFLLNVLSL